MLSLGTGAQTRAYTYEQARWWGQLGWARPALDMVFDGVADTIEFEAQALMGDRYVRLQTMLELASDDLDDASARQPRRPAPRGRAADRRLGTRARPGLRGPCRLTPHALLLERDAELAALDALVAGAAAGSGRLVLIEGPAGIGKSGPARRACASARSRRSQVLAGARRGARARVRLRRRAPALRGRASPPAAELSRRRRPGRRAVRGGARRPTRRAPPRSPRCTALYWLTLDLAAEQPAAARDRRPALDRPAVAALPRLPRAAARRRARAGRRDAAHGRAGDRPGAARRDRPGPGDATRCGPARSAPAAVTALVRERLGDDADPGVLRRLPRGDRRQPAAAAPAPARARGRGRAARRRPGRRSSAPSARAPSRAPCCCGSRACRPTPARSRAPPRCSARAPSCRASPRSPASTSARSRPPRAS